MADKIHTIEVEGISIQIPKWASEETLSKIAELTGTSNLMSSVIAKHIKTGTVNTAQLSDDIQGIAKEYASSNEEVSIAKKESLDKKLVGAAKSTKNAVDKFSNTDAPLTSMVDMLGDMVGAISGSAKGMTKDIDANSKAGKLLKTAGIGVGALGGTALAWAGFQVGQIEQFAKAQETMINSGAIMFGDTSPYETLKQSAIASGLTYTELTKLVSQNGVAFQSLGNGVSSGTTAFTSMFKSVNETGDKFGDYGLRSAEMAEVLADYVNIQRMTLSKDMALLSTQDSVELGFHNLMIETTALASLTGENRSEILQKRLASLSQPQVAAALATMDKAGGGHAEVARSFISQFALLESSMGPVGKDISDRFNDYIFRVADTPADFDMAVALGPDLATALDAANNGFTDRVNEVFRSGDIDGANKMLVKEMAKMRDAEVGSSNVVVGSVQHIIQQLKAGGVMVDKQMKKLIGMSKSEYATYLKEIEEKSVTSGAMTVAMNNMKKTFMIIQDAFVYNLDEASNMAEKLANGLKSGTESMKNLLNRSNEPETNLIYKKDDETFKDYQIRLMESRLEQSGNTDELKAFRKKHSITPMTEGNMPEPTANNTGTGTSKSTRLDTPNENGRMTDTNKTKMMQDPVNIGDNKMSQHIEEIIKTKQQTVAVLNQMKSAMKSIQRSNDYKRAVDNTNKTA